MRIIFIRHGEPDYKTDSLTEKGFREAEILSERVKTWNVKDFYVSPLGRARETAAPTLKKMGREAVTLEWMKEFSYMVHNPNYNEPHVPWDFIPSDWTSKPEMFDIKAWMDVSPMDSNPEIKKNYSIVTDNFDKLLEKYGYVRKDNYYIALNRKERFVKGTSDHDLAIPFADNYPESDSEPNIVIFCHLGVTCVVLSHLLNIPFQLLVHGFYLPPTSCTILNSEERWGKDAYFRVQAMGDIHHLLSAGERPSNAGSFARTFAL